MNKRITALFSLLVVTLMVFAACTTSVERQIKLDDLPAPPPTPVREKPVTQKPASSEDSSQVVDSQEITPEPEPIQEPVKEPEPEPVASASGYFFSPVVDASRLGSMGSLSWTNSNGGTTDFKSHGGKVYLIDVWAEWCPPCKASTKTLIDLHNRYAEDGLVIIGINIDDMNNLDNAKVYARDMGIPYVILSDPSGRNVAGKYVQQGIPNFTLLDSSGAIIKEHTGMLMKGNPGYDEIETLIRVNVGQ
ncbi:MAG TPA: TlpA disulfide reductase family protein [Caldisericia bacterium]|nr:TlpA disulfide reductase family protein [Caldisericia bacterium]HPF48923.1 TlpA disulfide reductase family protein [Caldisericia bacterium]HPI83213.1 TlpA disulfide reductase family protein [Caldisericia bacterium]HPQ92440.1 TlpA disulfide reductase family protein [Caldisericia bacterium]HRV74462.1 TlpA disulfide reductase family protein [Caldisericia bacterium]